ncbi:CobW-like GTP-binding protein [Myxococcota bacterium]|nr:CobW-like GTP-binding protein [Myxococcota bacterium]
MVLVHLVCGWRGVGKTRWIEEKIDRKPQGERWQVWFPAQAVVRGESLKKANEQVRWRFLPSACACCTGRVAFQVAFVRAIREDRPTCVWIEIGAGVDPQGLLEVLQGEGFRESVRVGSVVALVEQRQWKQPRLQAHEGYRAHLEAADTLYLRNTLVADTIEESDTIEAWTEFREQWRGKRIVMWSDEAI